MLLPGYFFISLIYWKAPNKLFCLPEPTMLSEILYFHCMQTTQGPGKVHDFHGQICFNNPFGYLGICWDEIYACVQWMRPFSAVVRDQGTVNIRLFDKVGFPLLVHLCIKSYSHFNILWH